MRFAAKFLLVMISILILSACKIDVYHGIEKGFIDNNGSLAIEIPEGYSGLSFIFLEEIGYVESKSTGKFAFINKEGNLISKPVYDIVNMNVLGNDDIITIKRNGKYGYVDYSANEIIEPKYNQAHEFNDGLAVVKVGLEYFVIKADGSLAFDRKFSATGETFREGLLRVRINEKWGYVDKKGNMKINPAYENAQDFSEGLAAVKLGGEWGFIDKKGSFEIEPKIQFRDESRISFNDGLVPIPDTQYWAYEYLNRKGEIAFESKFLFADDYHNGLALVIDDQGNQGYINTKGEMEIVINENVKEKKYNYNVITGFTTDLSFVAKKSGYASVLPGYGYMNKHGVFVYCLYNNLTEEGMECEDLRINESL